VDVEARELAQHVDVANRGGRGLVEARRIAQRTLDDVVEDGDGDIGEEQARDRLVHAAVLPERAGQRDPETARDHPRDGHRQLDCHRWPAREQMPGDGGGEAAEHECPFAADHHQPGLCGHRDAKRGQDERGRARQRVLPRERAREPAPVDQRVHLERVLAQHRHEDAEDEHRHGEGADGDHERFRRPAEAAGSGQGGHGRTRQTLPMTPSTR
jgi:hypothetical protein